MSEEIELAKSFDIEKTPGYTSLSRKQKQAIDFYFSESLPSVSKVCKQVGVTRPTWYNWMKKPHFKACFDSLTETTTQLLDASVVRRMTDTVERDRLDPRELVKLYEVIVQRGERRKDKPQINIDAREGTANVLLTDEQIFAELSDLVGRKKAKALITDRESEDK